jgi:hypothetical protein
MATPIRPHIEQETPPQHTLFLAFELGQHTWKLGFTIGVAQPPRERTISAGDMAGLQQEILRAKQRFGLPENARVVSCYEAGRDGFWLHRSLVAHDVQNHVIDSASIEVNRRQRRAKTDRLDVHKLLTMLLRHMAGERKVWSVVRVPSVDQEDRRQLHRELTTAKQDRTRVINRLAVSTNLLHGFDHFNLQKGVYAPSVQKLSLTYYTHNDSGATIPELSGEKSYVPLTITWRYISGETWAMVSGVKVCPCAWACSNIRAMRSVL